MDPRFVEEEGKLWFLYRQGMQRNRIPARLTHVRVKEGTTRIKIYAFANQYRYAEHSKYDLLKHVKIAGSVTRIGGEAFYRCWYLVKLEIPKDSMLQEIKTRAFAYCNLLSEIVLPCTLQRIENEAFEGCSRLKVVEMHGDSGPSQLRTLEEECFSKCYNLGEMNLSKCTSLRVIPRRAFYACSSLKKVILPPQLLRIDSGAFQGCHSLERMTCPKTLRRIESDAFDGCTKLTTVEFQSARSITSRLCRYPPFPALEKLVVLPVDDESTSKDKWPDLLPLLFGETRGVLLGPGLPNAQQVSLIFDFLQPRMGELASR